MLLIYLALSVITLHASDEWLQVSVDRSRLVQQGFMECGPASLFNALALSSSPFREAVEELPGSTPRAKYRALLAAVAFKVSEFQQKPRLDSGTNPENLYFMARDLLGESAKQKFRGAYLLRREGEEPGALLERAFDTITRSLRQGLPPILLIKRVDWQITAIDPFGKPITPAGHYDEQTVGHFVVVTGIRRGESGKIQLRIFNPYFREDDLVIEARAAFDQPATYQNNFAREKIDYRSEAEISRFAYREIEVPVYRRLKTGVNSPYLFVNSPTFSLTDQPADFKSEPLDQWPPGSWWGQVKAELPTQGPRYYYVLTAVLGAH